MAGQVLEYDLEYREDGEVKIDKIKIEFVANGIKREFNKIAQVILETQQKWDEHSDTLALISAKLAGGEVEESIEELNERLEDILSSIPDGIRAGFFQERFDLIKIVLVDNGYKDSQYADFDFWDWKVEPAVMNDFLKECVFKDIEKKK